MAYPRGKIYAVLTILCGLATAIISIYVLSTCEFYEVTWTENGVTQTESPGLFLCKVYDSDKHPKYQGPTNGFDTMALIGGFGGGAIGTVATLMVFSSYWKWKFLCRVQNTALASFLFMMAVILQGLTALILIAGACGDEGKCTMAVNGWLSMVATGGWFLASCFNRETAPKVQGEIPK